jgi:hypothetical protein
VDAPKSILEAEKTLKTLSSRQIYFKNSKNTKKTQKYKKNQKTPQKTKKKPKKPTGLVFFFNRVFFQPWLQGRLLELYRRLVVQSYGYQHLLTLDNLERAGLLTLNTGQKAYATLRKLSC